jgi:hypothetical protein
MDMDVDCWSLEGSRSAFDARMECRERNGGIVAWNRTAWIGLLDRTMIPDFPVPRFPILDFRIPNSVWRMENLEYRTMRLRVRGAHMRGT